MIVPASRRVGKYEIRQKLGRGGMADVYLADDPEMGVPVALKLIEHAPDEDTRDFIEAEGRGARLQARLADIDPHVARVYDSGDLDGFFFVAMEYVDGQDLSDLMRRGPLSPEFASDVAIAVANTLENAHTLQVEVDGKIRQGIVHGDIKPKNIRIDARGEVRVLDFGIAKALSLSRRLTRNEFGSVPYASPERLDSGQVDVASDLWSLAVMLYEMVTGMQPYQAGTTELLDRMIRSRVPPPPAPAPCPEPLRIILCKAMAPDPASRYQSAREFAADLEAFRRGEDMDATRRTWGALPPAAGLNQPTPGDETPTGRTYAEDLPTTRTGAPVPPANGNGGKVFGRPLDSEATRRTTPVPQGPGPREWAHVRPKPRRGPLRTALRAFGAFVLLIAFGALWSGFSDFRVYERGKALQRQVETEQLTDLNALWDKWSELSKGNSSSLLLRGPRKVVKQKFVDAADRVIASYRGDVKQQREGDWTRARTWLSHALSMDPDRETRGKIRLCDGHLLRIDGTAHSDAAKLNEAVQNFTEAQNLLPKSPDPGLGLARLYVYGLKDVDKANNALEEAKKRGYEPDNRDKVQIADGYRERADRLWWDTRNIRGLPQEKDQIERAEQDYQQALELYQSAVPYGNSIVEIVRVQVDLLSVRSRLRQLDEQSAGTPQ